MLTIEPLRPADAVAIVAWHDGTDARFLYQWSADHFAFPLTVDQVCKAIAEGGDKGWHMYRIADAGELVGTITLLKVDQASQSGLVGLFLIDPARAGQGYGTAALRQLTRRLFDDTRLTSVALNVFAWNAPARRCYEKAGFAAVTAKPYPNGEEAVHMVLKRGAETPA